MIAKFSQQIFWVIKSGNVEFVVVVVIVPMNGIDYYK